MVQSGDQGVDGGSSWIHSLLRLCLCLCCYPVEQEQEQDGQKHADLVEGREAERNVVFCLNTASVLPAAPPTSSIGVPFTGRHLSFEPLTGNGNVDFHGDSSVSRDLLCISATLACQRKCLVLDSLLIRGPFATSWSPMGLCGFSLLLH